MATVQETQVRTTGAVTPPVAPIQSGGYKQKKVIFRAYQIIWYILGIIEVLLVFRFILKMFAANALSGFANLIYTLSLPLVAPFNGLFNIAVVQSSVFEWTTIVAGIVYAIVAFGLVKLFQLIKPTNPKEVSQKIDEA